MTPKVFGIGFHKTGTTSLADALTILGYRVTGPNGVRHRDIAHDTAWAMAADLIPRFDAFQDNPWPVLYRDVDQYLPGSRFVLTIRSEEAWLDSVVRHFGTGTTPMREWIYGEGSPLGHEDIYLERYRAHNKEVMEHFAERPDDLLVMRITDGEGWESLCGFLDLPRPQVPFPHSNPNARHEGDRWALRNLLRALRWSA